MAKSHPLDWFQKRAGTKINRNGKMFKIPNKESAPYCYKLQGEGFIFADIVRSVVVPSGPPNVCIACEG